MFKDLATLSDLSSAYSRILANNQIVSINQCCQQIALSEVYRFFGLFKEKYVPLIDNDIFRDSIVIVGDGQKTIYSEIQADIVFLSNGVSEQYHGLVWEENGYLRIVSTLEKLNMYSEKLIEVIKLKESANYHMQCDMFETASREYKQIADKYCALGAVDIARDYYAYAAISAENTEKWRRISYLWYCAHKPLNKNHDYHDFNSLEHTFPSISFERWNSFTDKEKSGRALQYSAYSDDNHNGPSDSYWIYEKAAREYLAAGIYGRAIECAVSATNRYSQCFHQVSSELIALWEALLHQSAISQYEDLLLVSFEEIYRNLNLFKAKEADFFYIQMRKIQERRLLKTKERGKYLLSRVWSSLTQYGTNITGITILTLVLVFMIFPSLFYLCIHYPISLEIENISVICTRFIQCVVISLDVFTGIGTSQDSGWLFHILIICETLYAYVALVIVSSGLIGKLLTQNI